MRPRAPTSTSPKRRCDVDAILPADVCDRLREVKRRWDPEGRIVANHVVSLEA